MPNVMGQELFLRFIKKIINCLQTIVTRHHRLWSLPSTVLSTEAVMPAFYKVFPVHKWHCGSRNVKGLRNINNNIPSIWHPLIRPHSNSDKNLIINTALQWVHLQDNTSQLAQVWVFPSHFPTLKYFMTNLYTAIPWFLACNYTSTPAICEICVSPLKRHRILGKTGKSFTPQLNRKITGTPREREIETLLNFK